MLAPLRCALKDNWREKKLSPNCYFQQHLPSGAEKVQTSKIQGRVSTGRRLEKRERGGTGLQGQQVTERLNEGAENLLQCSLGHRGKKWLKEFCFFFLPLLLLLLFSQKCQFHQSFDNYETCQLIVRIHQMCHKWQEMRSRILKLDGFQKSLTINAINHPGTSIFGCRKFCREQKTQDKKHMLERGARSECDRLMLYCQDCLSSYRGCSYAEPRRYVRLVLLPWRNYTEVSTQTGGERGPKPRPAIFLGSWDPS